MSDKPAVFPIRKSPSRFRKIATALPAAVLMVCLHTISNFSGMSFGEAPAATGSSSVPAEVAIPSSSSSEVELHTFASADDSPTEHSIANDLGPVHLIEIESKPLSGHLHIVTPPGKLVSDEDVATWNVVVTSVDNNQVIDRISLTPSVKEEKTLPSSPASDSGADPATVRFNLQGTQPLTPGVYELKLEPSVTTSSRWRELLPWERSESKSEVASAFASSPTRMWTLIVLPSLTDEVADSAATPQATSARRCFVHLSTFPIQEVAPQQRADASSVSSRITRIFSSSEPEATSSAQRWATTLAKIDQRLDTIVAVGADGIVLDVSCHELSSDLIAINRIFERYAQSKAARLGLDVWHLVPDDGTQLRRLQPSSDSRSLSGSLTVSSFLRSPAHMIRGHFPPDLSVNMKADFVWFGSLPAHPATESDAETSADENVELESKLASLPLLQRDPAFASHAWLSDWTAWCIHATAGPPSDSMNPTGLLIDESFISGEMIPKSVSVREASQLWKFCWSDDSRWLTRAPSTDIHSSPGSIVHVRHANLDAGTALVCINRAPWPVRVEFPNTKITDWSTTPPPTLESIRLASPVVGRAGTALVIPASGVIVGYYREPLAASLPFIATIDEAPLSLARVTGEVTTVLESLGLLGELAGMTSHPRAPVQLMVPSRSGPGDTNRYRTVSDTSGATAATSGTASRGASLWSTDRWGFGRSITPRGEPDASAVQASATQAAPDKPDEGIAAERSSPFKSESVDTGGAPASRTICRNLVTNGGFEQRHEIGIPGWMHSHHPADAVVLDSLVRCEGNESIRMSGQSTSGASSWLISRDIAVPFAGRIGVSMSIRCEPPREDASAATKKEPNMPMEIRVAIEGERDGQPIRHSETIPINPDGKWQIGRVVLEWLDVDPMRDRNLRVTIDNFAPLTVWIDDVVVTDYFASNAERTELQSLAYLAVQGLQHSDLRPAAKLLANYWAKDLLRIAGRTSVSMVTPQVLPADTPSRSRLPFDVQALPTPMWRDSGIPEAAAAGSPTKTATELLALPPIPQGTASRDQAAESPAPLSESSTPPQASKSISSRIRGWLPAPLRF